MNIVYKLTNLTKLKSNQPPYFYIGSKTNCKFQNNLIYTSTNKVYKTSSKCIILKNDIENNHEFIYEILYIQDKNDEKSITEYEKIEQLKNSKDDWNLLFYNKSYASGKFTTYGYANYHYGDNKLISLPINHIDVLSKKAIAQNKNKKASLETLQKLKLRPHANKTHNWSIIQKNAKKPENTENYKGPKSEQHKKNISLCKMKKVDMYDLSMNFIKTFTSIDEARILTGTNRNCIRACCNKILKTSNKQIWRWHLND